MNDFYLPPLRVEVEEGGDGSAPCEEEEEYWFERHNHKILYLLMKLDKIKPAWFQGNVNRNLHVIVGFLKVFSVS
jgi:hypothetical protein